MTRLLRWAPPLCISIHWWSSLHTGSHWYFTQSCSKSMLHILSAPTEWPNLQTQVKKSSHYKSLRNHLWIIYSEGEIYSDVFTSMSKTCYFLRAFTSAYKNPLNLKKITSWVKTQVMKSKKLDGSLQTDGLVIWASNGIPPTEPFV